MINIQEVFNRIQEAKKEQREIKTVYRDALGSSEKYQEILEEMKVLKEKKKAAEEVVQSDFKPEFDKLDSLKQSIDTDNILISDIALNQYIKGEKVEIFDKNETQYEPVFSVRFKKQ